MSYKKIIEVTIYDLEADVFWDIWESLVLKHFFDILSVLRKACNSKCFSFLIFILKFGQSQFYASYVGNMKTVSSYIALEGVPKSIQLGKDICSIYKDLMKRGELTWVDQKTRYSGKQQLQAVQDLDVLGAEGLFFFCTLLRVLRQSIYSSVSFVLTIVNSGVVTREFLSPADLSGAQTLHLYEPTEVVVVGKHKHLMLRSFYIVLLSLEGLNDG